MKQLSRLLALVFASALSNAAVGYEVETHEEMSAQAAQRSVLTNTALSDIGLGPLATERLAGRSILDWIRHGANHEDDLASRRFVNHFYNPLSGEGLTGFLFRGLFAGLPSPVWGLEDTTLIADQYYSLPDARDYFYKGLTLSGKTEREAHLALTFNTLGHVVHLIQDAAQPQHTRDDPHLYSLYEKFTNDLRGNLLYGGYPSGGRTIMFTKARDFWHTSPPESDPFQNPQLKKGMAEYSNRGFVSAGTNFRFSRGQVVTANGYPAPAFDPASEWSAEIGQLIQQFPDCQIDPTKPAPNLHGQLTFYKNTVVDSYEPIGTAVNQYTTTTSIFDDFLRKLFGRRHFTLNKFNYCAANRFLIKRAVGYSAGLLDYFFRGRLEIENVTDNGQLQITVRNVSGPNNTLRNGVFELYYEATDGTRKPLTIGNGAAVDAVGMVHGDSRTILASSPDDIDKNKTNPFILVFKGTIGLEEGIIGKVLASRQAEKFVYVLNRVALEPNACSIQIFRKDGTFVSQFDCTLAGEEDVHDIAVDAEYIYITGTSPYVRKYTKSGVFVSQFQTVNPDGLEPEWWVSNLAVDANRVYTITYSVTPSRAGLNPRVQTYTKQGHFISQFASLSDLNYRGFCFGCGLAIDDQFIYAVSFRDPSRLASSHLWPYTGVISIFRKTGGLVTDTELPDSVNVWSDDTRGLSVDDRYIYIAGWGSQVVYVFNKSGQFVFEFATSSGNGSIGDITVDNDNIYVALEDANLVKIFNKTGTFISQFNTRTPTSTRVYQRAIAVDR